MFQEKNEVLGNEKLSDAYYKIALSCHPGYAEAAPGQFVTLRFGERMSPLLRRPFSIHRRITAQDGQAIAVEVLYKVVGACTEMLSAYKKGDRIDVLGPLGNSFPIPDKIRRVFIVAGGVGVAPMVFLVSEMQQKGLDLSQSAAFIGGRSAQDILCRNDFSDAGMAVFLTTDDGSEGKKGLVTEALETAIRESPPDMIYACGPRPMLCAVARMAETCHIPCRISVETLMACGMGACLGCAAESKKDPNKYLHVCIDGPVFDTDVLNVR
jgi:dihydroorotate dehydrogenase electron transfer subunit